jgi:hypothetical protein
MRYSSAYPTHTSYPLSTQSTAHAPYRRSAHRSSWPPRPSVEEESASLAKEYPSSSGSKTEGDGDSGEAKSRGTVDQFPIIEELDHDNDERRFVLVTDPDDFAHLPVKDPPVYTKRTSTPYAYTKPQKESLAPSTEQYYRAPEPRHARDQDQRPAKAPAPKHHDSYTQAPSTKTSKNDVFEDSDGDSDNLHLRTEPRRSGRYSFVKSDLQKEHVRTKVSDSQAKSERRKHKEIVPSYSASREPYGTGSTSSSGSSKHPTPQVQSPRSSSSSLNSDPRRHKPPPIDTGYSKSSKHTDTYSSSRPSSPSYRERPSPPRSPRLPPRPVSPITSRPSSRPSSRNGARPSSPLSFPTTVPRSNPQVPITEADWHATYPPVTDRSRPISRPDRYETMSVPMPHINIKSPSPARPPKPPGNPLPYPVDDRITEAFMPPEEQYQYDHSSTPTHSASRQPYTESPIPSSPRLSAFQPSATSRQNVNDLPRSPRVRSDSTRSQTSHNARRERKPTATLSADRPLPTCPRKEPTAKYNDWYSMENCSNFDICPTCYEGVFADTPFAIYFAQYRRYERPIERFCDFSSVWIRLAWHLTIKQRRQSPDLIYALATIAETDRSCPGDRELSTDRITWYGIPDQRDGIHVANFAICPCDLKMMEALFPTIRGYFTRLPTSTSYIVPMSYTCSLRVNSRRFPKYLELLMELDAEAQLLGQRPNINRFVQMARENAFKNECIRDKPLFRKPWHYMPQLPEFTVCQECFQELIWPAIASSPTSASSYPSTPNTLPQLFNRTIQPVPTEDSEIGSSCYLYSPRMRSVWERAVQKEDFGYLKRKVLERKMMEAKLGRERKGVLAWMSGLERGGGQWERAKQELKGNESEWREWE